MHDQKSFLDNLKRLIGGLSKEGVLPAAPEYAVANRVYLRNEELPEVAEDLALYNSGYIADKGGFNLSLVPYKQKVVV